LRHEKQLIYEKNSEEKKKRNKKGKKRIPDKVFKQGGGQCPVSQRL
jgi:hypothetical protein